MTRCILILFALSVFQACTDNIPRGRPTLSLDTPLVTDVDENTDENVDENAVIQRPSGAIIIQADACACQNGKPISIGDCAGICAAKQSTGDATEKLFFNVELTEAITLDVYQDVKGWCSTLPSEDVPNSCSIEVKDEEGMTDFIAFDPQDGQTSFEIEATTFDKDETYRLTITEETSGARSTTIQLRLYSELIDDTIGGPLALMPVSSYSCLFRDGFFDQDTGELIIEDVNRFHFYFIPETRPEPLSAATVPTVNCYDIEIFGNNPINSPLLEESTGVFTVWNKDDPRFFDLSGNGTRRVHELIEQNIELQGQTLSQPLNLFFPLNWLNGFDDGEDVPGQEDTNSLTTSTAQLGFYMTPFMDDVTFKAYCPTRNHYFSDSPLFKAMREIVAVDTEGLYAAKQDNVCDFLLIKESLLKQIWFYLEGGQHIEPTNDTVQGKQIQFYWPPDPNSPFIKKSHQRVYTLRGSGEITCGNAPNVDNGGQGSGGVPTNIPPHDKRIGCIPVLAD